MAIAGLLVPEVKSRCSQVPVIEMQVRGVEGGKGYGHTEKNVNGLINYFPCLSINELDPFACGLCLMASLSFKKV